MNLSLHRSAALGRILLAAALMVSACVAVIKPVPDFSGKWKLDREKSSGPSLKNAPTALEITQRGDEVHFTYFSGESRTGSEGFFADGTERDRYTTRIERAYSKARWDKNELRITTRHMLDAVGYQTYSDIDSWQLSEDRLTLANRVSDGSLLVYYKSGTSDPGPLFPDDALKGLSNFHVVGMITGNGPCHGSSFEATVKGEPFGTGTLAFCSPAPSNWGGKPGSCATHSGTLFFSNRSGGSSFKMAAIGQYCNTDSGSTFRGTYEVEKNSATGYFMNHILGGSGEVVFSNASNTISLNGVLLRDSDAPPDEKTRPEPSASERNEHER